MNTHESISQSQLVLNRLSRSQAELDLIAEGADMNKLRWLRWMNDGSARIRTRQQSMEFPMLDDWPRVGYIKPKK